MKNNKFLWVNGSLELLNHAKSHLKEGNEFDLRQAMISIDNAVELAIKTYLIKNRRTLGIRRKELTNATKNFPPLIDSLEDHNLIDISDEDLDAIEYYHKIRNNLYHEGVGITIEKNVVEAYFTLANDLIRRLFDIKVKEPEILTNFLQEFLLPYSFVAYFNIIESLLKNYYIDKGIYDLTKPTLPYLLKLSRDNNLILIEEYKKLIDLYSIRNNIVHKAEIASEEKLHSYQDYLMKFLKKLKSKIEMD